MELNELLESKVYKNGAVEFAEPETYISPFLERMDLSRLDASLDVSTAKPVINVNSDGSENIAYPRVKVQFKLKTGEPGIRMTYGLIYGLDVQNPVLKVYAGLEATACTNLYVFNADFMAETSVLSPNFMNIFDSFDKWMGEDLMTQMIKTRSELADAFLTEVQLQETLGKLLLETGKKQPLVPSSLLVFAIREMMRKDGPYYFDPDGSYSAMQIYDALTFANTKKTNLLYLPNKSLNLFKAVQNSI